MTAKVTIYLDCDDGSVQKPKHLSQNDFFDRCLEFTKLDEKVLVGRSSSDRNPDPDTNNAIFKSRVISRHHAEFSVETNGRVYVTDLNSTHGTYVNNKKLQPNVPQHLKPEDKVTFGTNVSHGIRGSFDARTFTINYLWQDMENEAPKKSSNPSGSFKVPDNSSEEDDSEPEVLSFTQPSQNNSFAQTQPLSGKAPVIELFSEDSDVDSISGDSLDIISYERTMMATADEDADLYNEDDEEFAVFSSEQDDTPIEEPRTPDGLLTEVNASSQAAESTLPTPPDSEGKMKIDHIIAPEDAAVPSLQTMVIDTSDFAPALAPERAHLNNLSEQDTFIVNNEAMTQEDVQEESFEHAEPSSVAAASTSKTVKDDNFDPIRFTNAMSEVTGLYEEGPDGPYDAGRRTPYPSSSTYGTSGPYMMPGTANVPPYGGKTAAPAETLNLLDVNSAGPYRYVAADAGPRARGFQSTLHALRGSHAPAEDYPFASFAKPYELPPLPPSFSMDMHPMTQAWLHEESSHYPINISEPRHAHTVPSVAAPAPRSRISISSIVDPVSKPASPAIEHMEGPAQDTAITDGSAPVSDAMPLLSINAERKKKRKADADDVEELKSGLDRLRKRLHSGGADPNKSMVRVNSTRATPQQAVPKSTKPGWGPSIRAFMFGTVVGSAMMFGGLLKMAD